MLYCTNRMVRISCVPRFEPVWLRGACPVVLEDASIKMPGGYQTKKIDQTTGFEKNGY